MGAPYTLEDAIRIHDTALYNWLGSVQFHYPRIDVPGTDGKFIPERKNAPLLRVFSAPARAAAKVVDTLVRLGWAPTLTDQELRSLTHEATQTIMPVPFVTIQRSPPRIDPEQSNVVGYYRRKVFNCETGQWEFWRWPKPHLTDYTITFLSRSQFTATFFLEWLYAQFGNPGALQREAFVDVLHLKPFGPVKQRLRLTGDPSDISDVETEDERLIRIEFTLELRTWLMMPRLLTPPGVVPDDPCVGDAVTDIASPVWYIQKKVCIGGAYELNRHEFYWTHNLYHGLVSGHLASHLCKSWIVTGSGWIESKDLQTFRILVNNDSTVQFFDVLTDLTVRGVSLVSVATEYRSDRDAVLSVVQEGETDEDEAESVFEDTLPKSNDGRFHQFILTDRRIITATWKGSSPEKADVTLSNIDLRIIGVVQNPVIPSQENVAGGKRYDFYNLVSGKPYLLVLQSKESDGPKVLIAGDDVSPDFTRPVLFDSDKHAVGVAVLMASRQGTASLFVPDGVVVDAVWAQVYNGHFTGNV